MKIAILSGKGGTGKTFVAVNLAALLTPSTYLDCDVEAPNGELFFKSQNVKSINVKIDIPKVDNNLCDGCRKCVDFCRFNALSYIYDRLLIFSDLCHSCGGCKLICPQDAIIEVEKEIGKVTIGKMGDIKVVSGIMNIGEASGVPIINKVLEYEENNTIIDCPPGCACTVMESINDADYCIIVTEPTLFGVENLKLVYELVKVYKKPFSIIINKYINDDNPVSVYCKQNQIKILAKIPFDKELAKIISVGKISIFEKIKYRNLFMKILNNLSGEINEASFNS